MEANKESGKNIFKETGNRSIFSAEHKRHKCNISTIMLEMDRLVELFMRASRDNSLHEMGGQCAPFRTQVMSSSKLLTHFISYSRSFSTASFASMSSTSTSTSTTTPAITHTDPAKNDDQQQPLQSHKIVDTLYSLKNQPHLAFSIFSHLKHPDIPAYAAIIRILCHWGLHKMLHSIFLHLHHNNNDFSFDISHLLDMLSLPHHIDIDLEKEDTVKHRSSFLIQVYDALVKSYVTAGMLDEAINALFQFKRRGFLPRIFTFNYLMNKFIENGKVDAALAIYKQLKSLGLSPNDYTYSIIIKAFCRKGSLVEASNVFQEMELCGVIPNVYAYTTYIEGLCANQRSELGYQVLQAGKKATFLLTCMLMWL
uniref:Pentacotripeptide-repeat region of PRORP domain-containing protein n=1 Tax=Salix viminalis TaxID=40686 RepID=A0A6N2NJA5_SALVM